MEDLTNFGWETYDSLFIGAGHAPLKPRFGYLLDLLDFVAYRRKEKNHAHSIQGSNKLPIHFLYIENSLFIIIYFELSR
jgi:hypothetical protein